MIRQIAMILVAFAVLVGSGHSASLSHNHFDGHDHAIVVADAADHHDHDNDADGQLASDEEPSDRSDIKGDVPGHHSHPSGIAATALAFGFGSELTGMTAQGAAPAMLASFSQAPPTQPPSA